jgi:hypothetical protein
MGGCHEISFALVLVVIGDFYFVGVFYFPAEADAPLVVNANAVLSFAVPRKGFEPVARWNAKFFQASCLVEDTEFIEGTALYLDREFRNLFSIEYAFRAFVCETLYHLHEITHLCDSIKGLVIHSQAQSGFIHLALSVVASLLECLLSRSRKRRTEFPPQKGTRRRKD